jgi:D-3-phosphoglycerate dehydrogenase / 2-oxoglutarate reductase
MKVLFVDTVHPYLEEKLKEKGFQTFHFNSTDKKEFISVAGDYEGLVIRSKFLLDKEILDHCKNLQFIARAGAGMESIDVAYAESLGIKCINSPEGNRDAVGEHAMGMLLMLLNHLKKADAEVRNGIWIRAENRGHEIMGKTVGLIGYGNTGSKFAKKLSGFECEILVYDKYKKNISDPYVKQVEMKEIFEKTDILSLHIPLTEETMYLVDKGFIHQFKKPIYIINTSRGKNLRKADLVEALKTKKVLGACLDVSEYESISFENLPAGNTGMDSASLPEAFQYLIKAENVVLTPHIAGWTHESNYKMSYYLAEKILAAFK